MDYTTLNKAKLIASQRIMDDYVKNGGAYMAQNKLLNLDENKSTTLSNASKKSSRTIEEAKQYIRDTIATVKSKHGEFMPRVDWSKYESELQTKEYNGPTQSEIIKSAEDKYADYKQASINKIMLDYDTDKNTINNQETDLNKQYQDDKSELEMDTINTMEGNQQRAISQGIQDSSILSNQQNEAVSQFEAKTLDLDNQYSAELNTLEMKKNLVEAQKDLALENFDISYANKLNSEINKLTSEQNKIKAEVEKHNAAVEKRKQEIQAEFEKANADRIAQINDDIQRDIVSKTYDILKTMPRSEAMRVLKDPEIASVMGDWLSVMSRWLRDY